MQKLVLKNTLYAQVFQLIVLVLQAIYFILIARALSPSGYGAYVSALAIISFFAAFSSWGSGRLMIRDIATIKNKNGEFWGGALTILLLIGGFVVATGCLIGMTVLPNEISFRLILYISAADCFFSAAVNINSYVFQAIQQIQYMGLCRGVLSLCRTLGVLLFLWLNLDATAENWALFYMLSSLMAAILTFFFTITRVGYPRLNLRYMGMMREGFSFAAAGSATQFSNDIDKVMLSAMEGMTAVGIYGAAYKLINISFSPVLALLTSTYARFFEKGAQGTYHAFRYALKLTVFSLPVGLIIAFVFILFSPFVPLVLGDEYAASVTAMRWLAFLPSIKIFQYFGGDALSGIGLQHFRMFIIIGATIVNIGLNLWLIPEYSWKGAIFATLVSDSIFAISIWIMLLNAVHSENNRIISKRIV